MANVGLLPNQANKLHLMCLPGWKGACEIPQERKSLTIPRIVHCSLLLHVWVGMFDCAFCVSSCKDGGSTSDHLEELPPPAALPREAASGRTAGEHEGARDCRHSRYEEGRLEEVPQLHIGD